MLDRDRARTLLLRLTWLVCALVLAGVVAGAIADRAGRGSRAVAPPGGVQAAGPPAGTVHALMPEDRVVRARVGDLVTVDVVTPEPDQATIPQLGVDAATSSQVPGTLEFVAVAPGRYPVVLMSTQRPVGTVVVER